MSDFPTNAFSGGGGLPLSGGTLTGPVLIADGSAAAPSLMTAAAAPSLIGFYGTAQSLILASYGNAQFAFATPFNGSAIGFQNNATLEWTAAPSPISAPDVIFGRGGAAATLQMGRNHATTPTPQCFKAHNVTTGTTAGGSLELAGGTGATGVRGNVTLNGGNRVANIVAPYAGSMAGGSTVDIAALDPWVGQVNAALDALIQMAISHGLMSA